MSTPLPLRGGLGALRQEPCRQCGRWLAPASLYPTPHGPLCRRCFRRGQTPGPRPLGPAEREPLDGWVRATRPRALAFALWLNEGDYWLAEDLVQAAYARLLERPDRADAVRHGPRWLLTHVRRGLREYFRQRSGTVRLAGPVPDRRQPGAADCAILNEQYGGRRSVVPVLLGGDAA